MPRRSRFVIPVDTCLFSPLQLQPATALRIGMSALASTIRRQLVEWRILKQEFRTTVVIAGVHLEYLRAFDFFSASEIEVDAGLIARKAGKFLELDCRMSAAGDEFARLRVLNRPVRLSGSEALDATPADLDQALLARLPADEHDGSPITRPLPDRLAAVERGAALVGERTMRFMVSRADCEIADQWQNVRLPDWLTLGRERLVLESSDARLKAGLRQPMSQFFSEFRRPMYFADEGLLHTRAYHGPRSLVFVHEVCSVLPGATDTRRPACAVAIEEFPHGGVN
jgi:hypothetical protein